MLACVFLFQRIPAATTHNLEQTSKQSRQVAFPHGLLVRAVLDECSERVHDAICFRKEVRETLGLQRVARLPVYLSQNKRNGCESQFASGVGE